ncbi:MAG: tyrosine-type recombinase/integrase [Verrucomicrobiota bacterium]|jgi:integrase
MKTLVRHLQDYLTLRRSLGFKLRETESLLRQFVRFAKKQKIFHLTIRLAVRWATQPAQALPATLAARYQIVRLFALYLSTVDGRTEVPPAGLLVCRRQRKPPYFYTDQQVVRLVRTARKLSSAEGLKGPTLSTLLGLVAVTGMRIGEAVALDRQHVDLSQGLLTIHHAKGDRVRLIPLHKSSCTMLRRFERLRDRICPHPQTPSFFVSETGGHRLNDNWVRIWFANVSRQIGLRGSTDRRGPRIHDLRHRFAIKAMVKWYRTGKDAEAHLPELATYMGHQHVSDTYWYLSATPELLQAATRRWQRGKGVQMS